MKSRLLLIACLLFLVWLNTARGQNAIDSTSVILRVELSSGNEFYGPIARQDSLHIVIQDQKLGEVSIPRNQIKKMEVLEKAAMVNGTIWLMNPQSTRYFWAPNGYGLKTGEGYYQNVWVLYNQFSVGVTNNFSLGAGMIPLFFFAGTSTPVWLIPKISLPVVKDKFNVGMGAIIGTVIGETNTGFGIVYGVTTFGNRNNNVNLGLGYGYAAGDWAKSPLINLSAMARTGPRGYLVTDNYFIGIGDQTVAILSAGGRTIVRNSAGIDYGLIFPISADIGEFIAIPWLGITIPFGTKANLQNSPASPLNK